MTIKQFIVDLEAGTNPEDLVAEDGELNDTILNLLNINKIFIEEINK